MVTGAGVIPTVMMATMTLGALTMAWISAEAARPLEWKLFGLFRFDGDLWDVHYETVYGP